MTWFKVDDHLTFHPKALAAGNTALGLWVRAGSWSSALLTDGHVPLEMVTTIGTTAQAERLVKAGLWLRDGKAGWVFHEWAQYQPSAKDVKRALAAAADGGLFGNHLRWHKRRGVIDPECAYCRGEK